MAYVTLHDVIIDFPVINAASHSLQLRVYRALGGKLSSHHNLTVVRALDGIKLELQNGDRLGLIGHNGAGKTTLLRVLAGAYSPTSGSAVIEGSVSAFADITLGMDLEATGWENIIFRCVFMGMSFEEAKQLSPSIAEFSELGAYLDLPTRTYSAGMFLRLAFAISTSADPDILIMDEMMASGDAQFIAKAKRRLEEFVGRAKILVLASHDLKLIADVCDKVLWLEHGAIKRFGTSQAVIASYLETVN